MLHDKLLRHLLVESDTRIEEVRKISIFIASSVMLFVGIVCLAVSDLTLDVYSPVGVGIGIITGGIWLGFLLLKKEMPRTMIEIFVGLTTVSIILMDFSSMETIAERRWPFFLLLSDLLVVTGCRVAIIKSVIVFVTLWLLLQMIESVWRVGVFDISGTSSSSDRREIACCQDPPCELSGISGARGFVIAIILLYTNHFVLHIITFSVMREHDSVKESVKLCHSLLSSLLRFDLEHAGKIISSAPKSDMKTVASRLVSTLRLYRPHVSEPLFEYTEGSRWEPAICKEPPGSDLGSVAIAVCQIAQSDALWKSAHKGMKYATRTYAEIVRECIDRYQGYESKSVGDSFLVSFPNVIDACNFSLGVQERLMEQEWPHSLTTLKWCRCVPDIWNGPRVKIGIHVGGVKATANGTTSRFDYSGEAVLKAARLSSVAVPGSVAISEEVISVIRRRKPGDDCDGMDFESINNPIVLSMGSVDLKGFPESYVSLLIPQHMRGRKEPIKSQLEKLTSPHETDPSDDHVVEMQQRPRDSYDSIVENVARMSCFEGNLMSIDVLPPQFLKERLERIPSATSAHVIISMCSDITDPLRETPLSTMNELIGRVLHCAEQSEGIPLGVVSTTVSVVWNAIRRCNLHQQKAVRFNHLLYNTFREVIPDTPPVSIHVGIATGTVLSGIIGTSSQKYVSAAGSCVDLSGMLALSAVDLACFSLIASLPNHPSPVLDASLIPFLRPVDTWEIHESARKVTIYEIHADNLSRCSVNTLVQLEAVSDSPTEPTEKVKQSKEFVSDNPGLVSPSESEPSISQQLSHQDTTPQLEWGWSSSYIEAFNAGDHQLITEKCPNDRTAVEVSRFLAHGTHLRLPLRI